MHTRSPLRFSFAALLTTASVLAPLAPTPLLAQGAGSTPALARGAPIPMDSAVTVGRLPNGLRYYIRVNHRPEKRAELRLVVNAGSILENDQQLGLAHFIEHMAFNGTAHYPKDSLLNYLQSVGVRFGADLNASTSFDETIYMLPIPTDTARIVRQGIQILADWARGQLLDSAEVVAERGVVREEWRSSQGASERMMRQWLPVAFKGSRYALRLPIGNEQSIMTATPSRLRGFYDTWYRPDLMAVVAVGDFDPDTIEALIKRDFSGFRNPKPEQPRTLAGIPGNAQPLVAIASDKENTGSSVSLIFKLPREQMKTVADYQRGITESLYFQMLNNRFTEIAQKPDAPFLGAGASKGDFFARTVQAFSLNASVKDGGVERGVAALLTEARRVDQYGFLQSELDRAKQNLLRGYERSYDERDKTSSASFVDEYVGNFLTDEAMPGIGWEYRAVQQLLPTVTLGEVNTLAAGWISDSNRVVIALVPDKEGVALPTRVGILAAMDSAARAPVTPYTETVMAGGLMAPITTPGRVVAESRDSSINLTRWTLSNGVHVLVKPTDYKADEVLMSAYADGGTSLAPDSSFMSASLASQVVALSGLGQFNRVDLARKLSGKVASVSATIGDETETITGRASPKDLETFFQLIHLQFTGARLDTAAFQAFQNQIGPFLANRGAAPQQVFADTIEVTIGQHAFRARPLTPATFAEVNPQVALQFYKARFADASGFTFVFVGNVNLDTLKALSERYLATLPAEGHVEHWLDVNPAPPTGHLTRIVRMGTAPKATTLVLFTGKASYTPQSRFALKAVTDLFQILLDRTLREQLGGTYSPMTQGGMSRVPRQEYQVLVQFTSAPENVDTLASTMLAVIDSLQARGPDSADVEKVREQLRREHEVEVKQNAFWVSNIASRTQNGEDPAGLDRAYAAMINGLTAQDIQAAARLYLDTTNYARFVLLPASATPGGASR
ncbi:MAG TPA: insulinase family protein [Gemmatimonadaceae bacterium]|nr:insulinase family protein [Gemmatimonadaceae bacterium]